MENSGKESCCISFHLYRITSGYFSEVLRMHVVMTAHNWPKRVMRVMAVQQDEESVASFINKVVNTEED